MTRAAYLAWGEGQMQPMDEGRLKAVGVAMEVLDRPVRRERPEYRAWLLHRRACRVAANGCRQRGDQEGVDPVQGPTADANDDEFLEAKEVSNLEGVDCVEGPTSRSALRVIDGARQLGRLKHDILTVGPTLLIPAAADRAEHWLDWWVTSWEQSYREVRLTDLRSVDDLADIAFDSGVQLGAGKRIAVRQQALSSVARLEGRLRTEPLLSSRNCSWGGGSCETR